MRALFASLLLLVLGAAPVSAQTPTLDDFLKRVEDLGREAATLRPPPPAPQSAVVRVPAGGSIQAAVDAAAPGMIIALQPGATYVESVLIAKAHAGLTITSDGCALPDRAAQPSDLPKMATIQGSTGMSYGLWVMASGTTVQCLSFGPNPNGQGDMLRVGDSESTVLADVPDGVTVRQVYFHGDPGASFGQKRAIAANGSHLLIRQTYAEDIWAPGQDSQCVAVFSTPGPVTITGNIFGCASENILIGGVPPAGPDFLPSDVLTEGNVLYKPLKWKGASPARVVKNLYEVKIGRRIMARGNWMENHWQQAQPGPAIVLTLASNGTCPWCVMEQIGFEDNVVWNVSAGLSLTGYQYSYAPGSGAGVGFSIKNNLFLISKAAMGGNGRPLLLSNEPKDVLVDHNTFIHDGNSVVSADYGTKWPYQSPPLTGSIKAGPTLGFVYTNNVASTSSYGIFTPEGSNGSLLGTYFPGAIVGGNVWAGASGTVLARYNAFAGAAGPNVGAADFAALFKDYASKDYCPATPGGAGVDCARLPWALRALVPAGQ